MAAADNRAATGLPSISGTVQVEETLTANTSGIADEDELTNVSYSYQWIAGGSDIDGATGSTYTLTASEQGQTIQVRVSFTDDRNNAETLTSEATGAVAAADNRAATGPAHHRRHGAGGGDADGGHDGHRGSGWVGPMPPSVISGFVATGRLDTDLAGDATGSTYTLVACRPGQDHQGAR